MTLVAAGIVLVLAWRLLGPLGAFPGLVLQVAGGACALVAILRRRDRAVLTYAALLPLVNVLLFVAAELLVGHD